MGLRPDLNELALRHVCRILDHPTSVSSEVNVRSRTKMVGVETTSFERCTAVAVPRWSVQLKEKQLLLSRMFVAACSKDYTQFLGLKFYIS